MSELAFKNTDSLKSDKVTILILRQLIAAYSEIFHGKICINIRPLFITFNHEFGWLSKSQVWPLF